MSLTISTAAPSTRKMGESLTLEGLLGGWPRPAGMPWYEAFRRESFASFLEADKAFGRYSRLRLNWASLEPVTPRFTPFDPGGAGSASSAAPEMSTLSEALGANPESEMRALLRPRDEWDHLLLSGWREGAFLRWGAGAGEARPQGLTIESDPGLSLEPVVLDVAPRAEAALFIRWNGSQAPAFRVTSLGGRVGDGATLKLVLLHEGEASHHLVHSGLELGRDASVEVFCAWLGGKWTVARFGAELARPGSRWKETHVILTGGKEHLDLDSQVIQGSDHTHCDVQVKTVAMDDSRAVFTGNILMDSGATQSDARLSDHVLLLSKGARADSIPGLEIKASDVQASHAASVGQVDEEEVFYLESRGLSREAARHLIVVGFLRSVLDRAPFAVLPEILDPILESKVVS